MEAQNLPQALPRQVISLISILLVVFLVAFPSSSTVVTTLVLLGGGLYVLQSKRSRQSASEVQMQPMQGPTWQAVMQHEGAFGSGQKHEDNPAEGTIVTEPSNKARAESDLAKGEREGANMHAAPTSNANGKDPERAFRSEAVEHALNGSSTPRESIKPSAAQQPAPLEKPEAAASKTQNGSAMSVGAAGSSKADRIASHKSEEASVKGSGVNSSVTIGEAEREQSSAKPLAGGAAVLARLRQQRAASKQQAAKKGEAREVFVAYASQTGTAQEIAKSIQAESASHGIKSQVSSLDELGFENLAGKTSAVLVVIAASTGDGDAPDNAAKFYATMRRKTQEVGILKGVRFTCLGLGDSNYTRFMNVSRAMRTRLQDFDFQELGAQPFHRMGEADEVDGLETTVDPWIEELWRPLKAVANDSKEDATAKGNEKKVIGAKSDLAAADGLEGVPALSACQIGIRWIEDATESTGDVASGNGVAAQSSVDGQDEDRPFSALLTSARCLTASYSDRKVLHLEVDMAGSSAGYEPGDSLSILPQSEDSIVNALKKRLGFSGEEKFYITSLDGRDSPTKLSHIPRPCTIAQALHACDITSAPRKSLLRMLAEHCSVQKDRQELLRLSSKTGRRDYQALINPVSPTLLDLVWRFPSCKPPLPDLLDSLPPLPPRLYSISSSALAHPKSAHIAFTVVRIGNPSPNTPQEPVPAEEVEALEEESVRKAVSDRWGVASGWLERKASHLLAGSSGSDVSISVRLRKGGVFSHPNDLTAPLLMIGPGTGVAPFRGFLQQRRELAREHDGPIGPAILYFGCRSPTEDYLYEQDFKSFRQDGTLSQLEVAFSREGPEKVYVQHLMKKQAKHLVPLLLDRKAFVFVCGDGAHMAKDVHATLTSILEDEANMSSTDANAHLANMTRSGRYIRDIWSS